MRPVKYFGGTVLLLAVLGVPAGFLWSFLAPRTRYVLYGGAWRVADPNTQALIAADGYFALITATIGLVAGLIAYRRAGDDGLPIVLGLAAGGLAGSFVAYLIGSSMGGEVVRAATSAGEFATRDLLGLTAKGVLVFWAVLAAGVFWAREFAVTYRERKAADGPILPP
ncbi:hypothetical protein [Herbidospora yilanensis]|uniref:hypothetical protein n=1 Tax=Herbidospora yilanensis TaxID=354426 RepID=UPI0012FA3388|nr:hypothetical protein [Herbidospora yilanensis]